MSPDSIPQLPFHIKWDAPLDISDSHSRRTVLCMHILVQLQLTPESPPFQLDSDLRRYRHLVFPTNIVSQTSSTSLVIVKAANTTRPARQLTLRATRHSANPALLFRLEIGGWRSSLHRSSPSSAFMLFPVASFRVDEMARQPVRLLTRNPSPETDPGCFNP